MRLHLRSALRYWQHNQALAATVTLLLAIAIGANTLIFSFINSLLLKSLPVRNPANLFLIEQNRPKQVRPDTEFFYPVFEAIRARKDLFASVIAEQAWSDNSFIPLETTGNIRVISTAIVSPNYFSELGIRPVLGRLLSPADANLTSAIPVVISYQFWQSQFSRRADVIGRVLRLKNFPFRIVGVLPREFHSIDIEQAPDVRLPISAAPILYKETVLQPHEESRLFFQLLARLATGVTHRAAAAAITRTARDSNAVLWHELLAHSSLQTSAERSETLQYETSFQIALEPAARGVSRLRTQFSHALYVLMAGVAMLLLAVCANVSGLLLARSQQRKREIAIRRSVGATATHLFAQFLTENLLLAAAATVLGMLAAYAGAPLLIKCLPPVANFTSYATPPVIDIQIDRRVLLFAVALTVTSVLFFGLLPALRALTSDANDDLKGLGRHVTTNLPALTSIAIQLALGLVLTAGAVLILQTFWNLEHRNPGFDRAHVIELNLDPTAAGYSDTQAHTFLRDVKNRVADLPGVHSTAAAARPLMVGFGLITTVTPQGVVLPQKTFLNTTLNGITPGYFETLRIPLIAGRNLEPSDEKKKPEPIVVNTAFANLFFPRQNALGKLLVTGTDGRKPPEYVIVGLVGTSSFRSLREENPPIFYGPDVFGGAVIYTRTYGDPAPTLARIRTLLRQLDPRVPVTQLATLEEKVQSTLWQERLLTFLATFFGIISLLLAAAGVYGALDYSVAARKRELGIRLAVGAATSDIIRTVTARLMLAIAGGLLIGVLASLELLAMLRRLLFGVQPLDPRGFLIASAAILLCAAIAAFAPIFRAVRTDPVSALRTE